jgi:hypothetical protein
MSSESVLYAPEVETFDPNLDALMVSIVDFWEKTVRESLAYIMQGTSHLKTASAEVRPALNHQPQAEPASIDDETD